MPSCPEAMRRGAEEFLTAAFHAFGSLSPDNRITRVTQFESFPGGNSGQKLLLAVEYLRPEPGLGTELFAKFSRDLNDPFRDRRRYELEAEIRLADLSRDPEFPVTVARPCFADFHHETGTGLLITARIAFGQGTIEPLHPKCMDHQLENPLEHYRAIVSALARLAAAHKSGRLSPRLEHLFPYDAGKAAADFPIPQSESEWKAKVAGWRDFAASCPQLVPPRVSRPEFFELLEQDVLALLRHEATVRRFLHDDPDFIALCHWNTNIDNAWFWRDEAGELQCGLLDWGMVRQMNMACSVWGGLSASDPQFLDRDLGGLLRHYASQLEAHGGPALDLDLLDLHFDLSVAMLGLALMMDTPALVLARLPRIAEASGPLDPLLLEDQVVHGFLHVSTNFLNVWAHRDFGASLRRMLERREKRR